MAEERVTFITSARPLPGQAEAHVDMGAVTRPLSEIKEEWAVTINQVLSLIAVTDESAAETEGFSLQELSVKLGFSAKGKLAFIAEAGVEASVEVTFKRK